MKKEPIIYFPNEERTLENRKPVIGQMLCIGKPSRAHYEYVFHSLDYNSHTLNDLQKLVKLQGVQVKIISILKMSNGSEIAVLRKKNGKEFLKGVEKLFTDLNKGLESKELKII